MMSDCHGGLHVAATQADSDLGADSSTFISTNSYKITGATEYGG